MRECPRTIDITGELATTCKGQVDCTRARYERALVTVFEFHCSMCGERRRAEYSDDELVKRLGSAGIGTDNALDRIEQEIWREMLSVWGQKQIALGKTKRMKVKKRRRSAAARRLGLGGKDAKAASKNNDSMS